MAGGEMNKNKLMIIILVSVIVSLAGSVGCSQRAARDQGAEIAAPEGPKITVKGTIGFMTNLGGYYIRGLEPGGELFIVNKSPQVLEELFKSGQTVMIEGRIVRGAEYLFIEKIDGRPYHGSSE